MSLHVSVCSGVDIELLYDDLRQQTHQDSSVTHACANPNSRKSRNSSKHSVSQAAADAVGECVWRMYLEGMYLGSSNTK
jgi:hypothetical protein